MRIPTPSFRRHLATPNLDPSESSNAAEETRDIAIVRVAPDDLPEHSLVSYNPNRTRFERPATAGGTSRARPISGAEDSADDDLIETQFGMGSRPAEPVAAKSVTQEDRHRLLKLIGRGGCGEVWEAIQIQLDRPVAVKRLREDRFVTTDREESREEMIRYFREEALIAARLDHPNIVPVYDYSRNEAGDPELSMKLVRGRPWDKLLKSDRLAMKFEDLIPRHLAILAAVANSVAFAHSRNIVHRDIKPSQVMVGDYGEVLLMDWGLALVFGAESGPGTDEHLHVDTSSLPTLSTASSPAGTPAYMAPEQTLDSAQFIGPWTDVYLLGGSLYCILVGTGPYGDSPSHEAFLRASEAIVRDPREVMPNLDIPDELAELALKALQREPRDRIESAAVFVKRLEDWISGASRRRESEVISDLIAKEIERPRTRYSEFVGILNRIQEAAGLWPGNPAVVPLRVRTLIEYGELALAKGDLLLAQTEAELLAPSAERDALLQRVEDARAQRLRSRRMLRIAAVAVAVLVVLGISGVLISNRLINGALEKESRQRIAATEAKDEAEAARLDAERAREKALNDQIYAQIRYATSLVEAGRHDMARSVLWSIPEASRSWEWAYLLSRANQPLAEFPFMASEVSRRGEWIFVDDGTGTVEVRDTMAGALVAKLDHETTSVLIMPPLQDTHVDTLDGGRRIVRWAPPDWKPKTLVEFDEPVVLAKRVYEEDDFLVGFDDRTVAILDADSGAEKLRLPAMRENLVAIDGYARRNIIAVAGKHELVLYTYSDGTVLRRFETRIEMSDIGIISYGAKVLIHEGLQPHLFDVATGELKVIWKFAGLEGNLATHPEAEFFARSPDFLRVADGSIAGVFPVSLSPSASVKFSDNGDAMFWGGASGEAGIFGFTGSRITVRLEGLDSPIVNMWNIEAARRRTIMDIEPERIFSTTEDGKTQVWIGGPQKHIARLPGQWSSFRDGGTVAVSIAALDAVVQRLDDISPPYYVGRIFSLYRSITINEARKKIYTFGYPVDNDRKFGWEVYDMQTRHRERLVATTDTPEVLPYLWAPSADDAHVAVMWKSDGAVDIWSADEGVKVAHIEPTDVPPTAMFCTPWQTIYVADNAGSIREYSLEDGHLIRSLEIGTAVWTARHDRKRGRLLVGGGDGGCRLYSISESGLELVFSNPSQAGPVVSANFASGGTSLLTQTNDGTMIVWELPSGREIVRFKVDTDIFKAELNSEGTRIFGIGDVGLYVWDTLGREVARIKGVRDIGPNGRRLLVVSDNFIHARDMAIELPPYRIDELPGESGQSFEERFQLYRSNEYRDWWLAKLTSIVPPSLRIVPDVSHETVANGAPAAAEWLDLILSETTAGYKEAGTSTVPILKGIGMLLRYDPDHDWAHFGNGLWFNHEFAKFEDPEARELALAVAPYAALNAAITARDRVGPIRDSMTSHLLSSVHRLALLGRLKEAKALARFQIARAKISRVEISRRDLDSLQYLLDSPVPDPPADLTNVSSFEIVGPWANQEFEKLASLEMSEEARAKARIDILERETVLKHEWLNSVAPLPDLDTLVEELRAQLPPPPPPDMLISDIVGDSMENLERAFLNGALLSEAYEDIGAKFDASVAAVKAERAAK